VDSGLDLREELYLSMSLTSLSVDVPKKAADMTGLTSSNRKGK